MQLVNKFAGSLNNTSVVIKSSIIGIVFFYLIGLIPGAYSFLSITPTLLLPPNFRVWTLVTGLIVERSIFNVLIDIPILLLCGMYLEPLWGALELLKFIGITGIGTTLLTSFVSLAAYAVTQNYSLWFVQFSGISGVIGGIAVAFKQITPDQKIDLKIHIIRIKDLPFLTLLISVFLSVIRVFTYTQPVMVFCGICVAWIYLRFYQSHGKGIRGDMSEHFDVASLFPPILRPFLRAISTGLFGLMVRFGWCKNPVRTYDVGAPSAITISLPGSDPADAERRRKKALRALNERLSKMQERSLSDDLDDNWVTIEDEIEKVNSKSSSTTSDEREENNKNEIEVDIR